MSIVVLEPPPSVESRYSGYLLEILRCEGFAETVTIPFNDIDRAVLGRASVVVLPRGILSTRTRELVVDHVTRGGAAVAIQPDAHLLAALGVRSRFAAAGAGYMRVNVNHSAARGLAEETVQLPVPVVDAIIDDKDIVARFAPTGDGQSGAAAALLRHGAGSVAIFTFDIAHAVARLRQGDPSLAGICALGLDGVFRPADLFAGWLDPRCIGVPQADILTALLARLIEALAPQPRVWYFPRADQRSVVVMTSDDDWSRPEEFDQLVAALDARGGTATFFLVPHSRIDHARIDAWTARGHAFSVHPALETDLVSYRDTAEPQPAFVAAMLRDNVARHRRDYGVQPATIRQHCARWLGYVDAARVLADLGVGMDCNYLCLTPGTAGYMSGSGRPLRFVDELGALIDVFQQPSLWTEEALIHPEFVFSLRWSVDEALAFARAMLDDAIERFYIPYVINSHPVSFASYSRPLVEGLLDHAVARGVPIVSADAWHAFTRARDAVRMTRTDDADGEESYLIQLPQGLEVLTVLLPIEPNANAEISAWDGAVRLDAWTTRVLRWQQEYLAVELHPHGATTAVLRRYGSAPLSRPT